MSCLRRQYHSELTGIVTSSQNGESKRATLYETNWLARLSARQAPGSAPTNSRLLIVHAKLISQTENGISTRTADSAPVKLHLLVKVDATACVWLSNQSNAPQSDSYQKQLFGPLWGQSNKILHFSQMQLLRKNRNPKFNSEWYQNVEWNGPPPETLKQFYPR